MTLRIAITPGEPAGIGPDLLLTLAQQAWDAQLIAIADGKLLKGKVGKDLTLEDGQNAARFCAINILAQVKKALNGDLNKVKNCIKITGFVNSTDDFYDQPKVINPASEMISSLFGNSGKHTRAAVSTNSLPLGAAVEIDAIFETE